MTEDIGTADLVCEERLSDSTWVETIWRSWSDDAGPFISIADNRYTMVFTKIGNKTTVTVRGPETMATSAVSRGEAQFLGIRFNPGVFLAPFPAPRVMDRRDLTLPGKCGGEFGLQGTSWEIPTFDNADTFVCRLVREEVLVCDPIVQALLTGDNVGLSSRQVQRRFKGSTGLTQTAMAEIDRARLATRLLVKGDPIADVAYHSGYFDQAHLTRSLKRFVGLTPGEIRDKDRVQRMSFLYKTSPAPFRTLSG